MKKFNLYFALFTAVFFSGCVHLVSYYDSLTYKNLTDLKGEAKVFFESCQNTIAKGEEAKSSIDSFVLSSAKAYEYEKGKTLNNDTISQLKIIDKTITEVNLRYSQNKYDSGICTARGDGEAPEPTSGCLTTGYCLGKWKVLESAFDIAIATEKSKLEESK